MKEIGRNVRFFGLLNGKMLLQMYAFTILFSLIMGLFDEGIEGGTPFTSVPFVFAMVGPIVLFLQAAVGYLNYSSMAIAMGSTRKNALLGMQIAHCLMLVIVLASSFVVWQLLPDGRILLQFHNGYAAILFLISIFANIMGLVVLKVGAKAGFVVYMISYMVVIGLVVGMIGVAKQMEIPSGTLASVLSSGWLVAAGLVLVLISMIGPYYGIRKFEVRA